MNPTCGTMYSQWTAIEYLKYNIKSSSDSKSGLILSLFRSADISLSPEKDNA
ncbi:hypothetical protein ALC60_06410 [Trachymyrmex zeteki]|uniref:Uncharacterized protein n=1 Tax=Mycetomoellerius zeteki TaxID=64791 RepID=A0A151X2P9_9HYME|nr:hypothetical protein ALC60_06410 [Trachymyrmex zeteki]